MSNGPSMNKFKCCKGYRAKCIQNTLKSILVFKTTIQKFFYLEMNTFIQQGCIQVDPNGDKIFKWFQKIYILNFLFIKESWKQILK